MKRDFVIFFMFFVISCLWCCVNSLPMVVASEPDELVESAIEKNAAVVPDQISEAQEFYEVDAFGDDFIDFGAETGPLGAYQWHANYPIHRSSHYDGDDGSDHDE